MNYYATNHTPEDLCELLRDAALRVNAVIERLQLVKKVVRHGQDAMKRYEAHGYRVEIEKSLARVLEFFVQRVAMQSQKVRGPIFISPGLF